MDARTRIRASALKRFSQSGYESVSVAEICRLSRVSNGSFFHAYATKEELAADLWLTALENYHAAVTGALAKRATARAGIAAMLEAHLDWVVTSEQMARILFEQVRPEWHAHIKDRQAAENERFAATISGWREPLVKSGKLVDVPQGMFTAQLIGPAQIFCRAWLSGRSDNDPRQQAKHLIVCAHRALLS